MKYISKKVFDFCKNNKITCSAETAEKFDILYDMLIEFNEHTNITSLKTEDEICTKHFIDSLYPLSYSLIPDGAGIIDIGCGGGFPGLPLKIVKNGINLTFLDSTEKKLKFAQNVCEKFGFECNFFAERAEELIKDGHREKYDVAVSRAVASLPILSELCIPYVKEGGIFIAYKSLKECDKSNPASELSLSEKAITALGAKIEKVYPAYLNLKDKTVFEHALVVIRKVKPTNRIFPRRYPVILKKPL